MKTMEYAIWCDWRRPPTGRREPVGRIYFGHETCEHLLPSVSEAIAFLDLLNTGPDTGITLVTPFLSPNGLRRTLDLIHSLAVRLGRLEVVCSDWGLIYALGNHCTVTTVLGRVLTAQVTDPRLVRLVGGDCSEPSHRTIRHVDGTVCVLKAAQPTVPLQAHYQGCWVDKKEAIALLSCYGVQRCELNNVAQGIALAFSDMRYTLHLPHVLVSVMRTCPGENEDFNVRRQCPCSPRTAAGRAIVWSHRTLPFELYRRDNALYYEQPEPPDNLDTLPVDRIVYPTNHFLSD